MFNEENPICLNYIWISAQNRLWDRGGSVDIENYFLENMGAVIQQNRDVTIQLWVEADGKPINGDRFTSTFNDISGLSRIVFRDLYEIDQYANMSLFREQSKSVEFQHDSLWQKSDLARLLVVEHCLERNEADIVFYSDMDIIAPSITAEALSIVNKHGLILATSDKGVAPDIDLYLENQFFGFTKRRAFLLSKSVIPTVIESMSGSKDRGYNGWTGFCNAMESFMRKEGLALPDISLTLREVMRPLG